ncbi:MAG TPA: hypothetical protein VMR98_03345 [Candidatus Polarisedimenticolaceae bacterium]|nr:hypothetical protein [Candidatus Polarisedimenticolaceae bacterium]
MSTFTVHPTDRPHDTKKAVPVSNKAPAPPAEAPKPPVPAPVPAPLPKPAPPGHLYGTLQSSVQRMHTSFAAGVRVVTLEAGWDEYEPSPGNFNTAYAAGLQKQLAAFRSRGMLVVLDPGLQYAPQWVLNEPNGRYVNQYGDAYIDTALGRNIANLVFNQRQRDYADNYLRRIMSDLGGGNIYAVRLGGVWNNELQYPQQNWNGHTNSYWGYDAMAQGHVPGLAYGMPVSPVPGWIPGTPSANHSSAAAFTAWYFASLKNYHDWQIGTLRKYYPGNLLMLYPSWGVRDGQAQAAINNDLRGTTSPEINGEVQRGGNYAEFVKSINDPGVIVYTTWLDAPFGNDASPDPSEWRPVHWLAAAAGQNPLHLRVWGENTGGGSVAEMRFAFAQAKQFGLMGVIWAFEPELYAGGLATLLDFQGLIAANP